MKSLFVSLGILLAFPLWAQKTPLDFWHSMTGEKGKLLKELIGEFNQSDEAKGYEVKAQFVGTYEEGLNKLRTSLLASQGPHIAQITDIGTQVVIDTKSIRPLQDFIGKDPSFPLEQILVPIRRYYEVVGKLYSLPFATSNPILFFNKDWFEKDGIVGPPRTFDELEATARKLTHKELRTTGVTWPLHSWFLEQFVARQGQELVNQGNGRQGRATQANFLSPEAVGFIEMWERMVKEGTFSNVGRGWDPAEANFLAGRSAMFITSTSDVFEVTQKASFRVGTASIPTRDLKIPGGTVIGGNSLWILNTKPEVDQQASYRFIRFMASKSTQRKWHTGTGYFPIRQDLISELEKEGFYLKFPAAKTAIDQLRASVPMTATQGALIGVFSETREHVHVAIERVLAGRMSVTKALGRAKEQTDEAMRRYNRFREKGK